MTGGRIVTLSSHAKPLDAEVAAQHLTAALTVRGEIEDYSVLLGGQDRAGRYTVCVRSTDAEGIILATCVEALLRWTAVKMNGV